MRSYVYGVYSVYVTDAPYQVTYIHLVYTASSVGGSSVDVLGFELASFQSEVQCINH